MAIKLRKQMDEIPDTLKNVMVNDEVFVVAYKTQRDFVGITTKRVVFVDRKGFTGKKAAIHTFPFRTIRSFVTENETGNVGTAVLKLKFFGSKKGVSFKVSRKIDIFKMNKIFANFVCN